MLKFTSALLSPPLQEILDSVDQAAFVTWVSRYANVSTLSHTDLVDLDPEEGLLYLYMLKVCAAPLSKLLVPPQDPGYWWTVPSPMLETIVLDGNEDTFGDLRFPKELYQAYPPDALLIVVSGDVDSPPREDLIPTLKPGMRGKFKEIFLSDGEMYITALRHLIRNQILTDVFDEDEIKSTVSEYWDRVDMGDEPRPEAWRWKRMMDIAKMVGLVSEDDDPE